MSKFRALMPGVVAAGLAFGSVCEVKADPMMVRSGTDKTKLTIKGHVNRGILIVDDGDNTEVFHVDNDASRTRLKVTGKGRISEDLSIKTVIEVGFRMNSTHAVKIYSKADDDDDGNNGDNKTHDDDLDVRHTYIGLVSKTFGALTTGHTSDAADGAAKIDLSGTSVAGVGSDATDIGKAVKFKESNGAYSKKKSIGSVFNNGDGTRTSLVRYDTPSLGGFTGHVSMAQGGWGVGSLTYSGAVAGFKVAGAVGYSNASSVDEVADGDVNAHRVGSVSALHESGVGGTLSYAKVVDVNADNRDKPMSYHAKLGYQAKLIDPGKSYFSVGYGRGENWQANGDEADAIQFGFKQDISAAATELYLSISRIALDTSTTTNYKDIVWGMAGARVKF